MRVLAPRRPLLSPVQRDERDPATGNASMTKPDSVQPEPNTATFVPVPTQQFPSAPAAEVKHKPWCLSASLPCCSRRGWSRSSSVAPKRGRVHPACLWPAPAHGATGRPETTSEPVRSGREKTRDRHHPRLPRRRHREEIG